MPLNTGCLILSPCKHNRTNGKILLGNWKEANPVGAENLNVDQLQSAKQWLERESSRNWMMVIDNADDENILFSKKIGQ